MDGKGGGRQQKSPSSLLGTKGFLPRYHPNSRSKSRTHLTPVTVGDPAVSPRQLPGEPNRASAVWLAAGDQTSLGGVSRLFSRSSLISNTTYSTQKREMQAPIRQISPEGPVLFRKFSIFPPIGIQNDMDHAAENGRHREDPPSLPPGVSGKSQPHIDGGGGGHDGSGDGPDEV